MPAKVFIDGEEGTTGLRIHDLLASRTDLTLLRVDPARRKETGARRELLNAADIVFLCLPDAAAREAVALIANARTKVIDASAAHRTSPDWAYGLPELSRAQREKIRYATRVANPGCHATAFLLPIVPLVEAGMIPRDISLTCFSLTGYSGGGKKMIAAYEAADAPETLKAPRPYALGMAHKHLPEMQAVAGLAHAPLFTPIVCNIHSGLAVETFLPVQLLPKKVTAEEVHGRLAAHYAGEAFVRVLPFDAEAALDQGCYDMTACNHTNRADISVFGNGAQIAVITRLDNLGKGAAGAAIQSLNLLLGIDETTALRAEI